jgi:hypothetical protein
VLLSALGRSGDIARTAHYEGMVCMCFKDITIKVLENDPAGRRFVAKFEMAQDKGRKYVRSTLLCGSALT